MRLLTEMAPRSGGLERADPFISADVIEEPFPDAFELQSVFSDSDATATILESSSVEFAATAVDSMLISDAQSSRGDQYARHEDSASVFSEGRLMQGKQSNDRSPIRSGVFPPKPKIPFKKLIRSINKTISADTNIPKSTATYAPVTRRRARISPWTTVTVEDQTTAWEMFRSFLSHLPETQLETDTLLSSSLIFIPLQVLAITPTPLPPDEQPANFNIRDSQNDAAKSSLFYDPFKKTQRSGQDEKSWVAGEVSSVTVTLRNSLSLGVALYDMRAVCRGAECITYPLSTTIGPNRIAAFVLSVKPIQSGTIELCGLSFMPEMRGVHRVYITFPESNYQVVRLIAAPTEYPHRNPRNRNDDRNLTIRVCEAGARVSVNVSWADTLVQNRLSFQKYETRRERIRFTNVSTNTTLYDFRLRAEGVCVSSKGRVIRTKRVLCEFVSSTDSDATAPDSNFFCRLLSTNTLRSPVGCHDTLAFDVEIQQLDDLTEVRFHFEYLSKANGAEQGCRRRYN